MSKCDLSARCMLFGYISCFIIMVLGVVPAEAVGGYGVKFLVCQFSLLVAMCGFYWVSNKIFEHGGSWR